MDTPLVSVIVANVNGRQHLGTLLESLETQDYPADRREVIVVDNGSTDGSAEFLSARHPGVRVLRNATNEGFARANNQGAEVARGKYLALLNNDVRLEPTWLGSIVGHAERASADVACLGSRILTWDGAGVDFAGASMAFTGMAHNLRFDLGAEPDELLFATGAAMLVERDVFVGIGGFDEDYFNYFEDVDLGWRLWLLGYRVEFCRSAVSYHRRNASMASWPETVFLLERNALFSIVKNYDDESLAAALPSALALAPRRAAARAAAAPTVPARRGLFRRRSAVGETAAEATLRALREFGERVPALMEKRAAVQSARRRADAEIVPLFREPLRVGGSSEVELARALGAAAYFERLLEREHDPQSA
jgi:GT2 family glycosyltransferase